MPIYTKSGDAGETSLRDGSRINKSDNRFEMLGGLDSLNAFVGLLKSYLTIWKQSARLSAYNDKFLDFHLRFLEIIQSSLFELGTEIANPKINEVRAKDFSPLVKRAETAIDVMERELPELKSFILPGGSPGAAYAHICRTQTRQAERLYFKIQRENLNQSAGRYLNRLSDYFFMLARFLNKQAKTPDIPWRG